MGPVGDNVKPCKRGHVAPRDRKRDCVVCKKQRDDRHRLNARIAGKDAERQLRWWHKRMSDPEFQEKQRRRWAHQGGLPERKLQNRLGVGIKVARDIKQVTG